MTFRRCRAVLVLISVLLVGCHRHRRAEPAPAAISPEVAPFEACLSPFFEGRRQYERFKVSSDPLDVVNFEMAAGYLEQAVVTCQGWEYEDDAVYSLGLSELFIGHYSSAAFHLATLLEHFPNSDFSANRLVPLVLRVLRECGDDLRIDTYRRAALYELFSRRVPGSIDCSARAAALSLYREAASSTCPALADFARSEALRLGNGQVVAPD